MTEQHHTPKQRFHDYATQMSQLWEQVQAQGRQINRMEFILMADQDNLNALAQALSDLTAKEQSDDTSLVASVGSVQQEIATLEANQNSGTPLDFSGVNDALTALQGQAQSNSDAIAQAASLVPAPASPPADGSGDGSAPSGS